MEPPNPLPPESASQTPAEETRRPAGISDGLADLILVFVYPIGLIVMWFFVRWSVWRKLFITLPLLLMIFLFFSTRAWLDRENRAARQQRGSRDSADVRPVPDPQNPGWYVYTSTNLGYSVSYPEDWEFSEAPYISEAPFQAVGFFPPRNWSPTRAPASYIDITASLEDQSYDLDKTKEDYAQDNPDVKAIGNLYVMGYPAKRITLTRGIVSTSLAVPQNGKKKLITIRFDPDDTATRSQIDEAFAIYERMHQTLKVQ